MLGVIIVGQSFMRNQQIKQLHSEGKTYKQISSIFGITPQRIYQIVRDIKDSDYKEHIYCVICKKEIIAKRRNKYCQNHLYLGQMHGRDSLREKVRIRDNFTCQDCGKIWKRGTRRLDVHHEDRELESNRTYQASKDINGLITLCHKCHLSLPHIKEKMRAGWAMRLSA